MKIIINKPENENPPTFSYVEMLAKEGLYTPLHYGGSLFVAIQVLSFGNNKGGVYINGGGNRLEPLDESAWKEYTFVRSTYSVTISNDD